MNPGTIAPALRVSARKQGGITIAELSGELDIASASELRDQLLGLLRPASCQLVVGLSGVTYCDASGLAVLVGSARRARLLGGFLRVAEMPPAVDRVLRVTGLQGYLGIFPSVLAATTSPQRTQHGDRGSAAGASSASVAAGLAGRRAGRPRITADFCELRTAVAALLSHSDAWRDADPGRRFTGTLRAMAHASTGADDAALATAARSMMSALARHPLSHSPAVASTATRLRRVLDREPALT